MDDSTKKEVSEAAAPEGAATPSTPGANNDATNKDESTKGENDKKRPLEEDGGDDDETQPQKLTKSQKRNRQKQRSSKFQEKKKNMRKGYDENVDERSQPPQEGSFANEDLRKQFGISLESEDPKKSTIVIGEDQSTSKKKVVILMGFLGTKYWGFQANPKAHTIQAELELALFRAGLISKHNFGQPNKTSFSMSARTDKGVHACAQVVSLKVELLQDEIDKLDTAVLQKVQDRLPDDIHVLDIQRTTRNFCAKTQRERVRYSYVLPSFLLHPDYKQLFEQCDISMTGRQDDAKCPLTKEEVLKMRDLVKDFRSTPEQRERLAAALKKYEGTHPFHNFTRGIKAGEAKAMRFIEFFKCQEPVIIDGIEWIPTQVLGQSFLLHQIRKMISMAIDVGRGAAPIDVMDQALSKTEQMRVHVAPAQGLFLEMSYFTGYNRRKQKNPDLPDLDWNREGPANQRWSVMRDMIRKHIVEEELNEGNFIQYYYMQECIFEYRKFYKLDGGDGTDTGTTDGALEAEDGDGKEES